MDKYSAEQIFESWFFCLRDNPETRYANKHRLEWVTELAQAFKINEISYDEALGYLSQVVIKLTTEEGRKGKGKHKGWKECVAEDFKAALAHEYVETKISTPQKTEVLPFDGQIPEDKWIMAWLDYKFDGRYCNEIKVLAHVPGNSLHIQFLVEVFESDWIKTSQNIPLWFKSCLLK